MHSPQLLNYIRNHLINSYSAFFASLSLDIHLYVFLRPDVLHKFTQFPLSANMFIVRYQEEEWDNYPGGIKPSLHPKKMAAQSTPQLGTAAAALGWLDRVSSPGPLISALALLWKLSLPAPLCPQWSAGRGISTFISPCFSSAQENESNARWEPAFWGPGFFTRRR